MPRARKRRSARVEAKAKKLSLAAGAAVGRGARSRARPVWRVEGRALDPDAAAAELLGLAGGSRSKALRERVQAGLPFKALTELQASLGLDAEETAHLLQVSRRTIERRHRKGRLETAESDALVRGARIAALALELFEGDEEAARDWMRRPAAALGGESPLALLSTGVGAREVEDLIGRLEHGVFT